MAQLSDDCFAFGGALLSVDAATALIAERLHPVAGVETVFMQEDVELRGDAVVLPQGLKRGANSRPAGEDLPRGARALEQGRRLSPQDVALAAALGIARLPVRERLRVAVFSTGNELV